MIPVLKEGTRLQRRLAKKFNVAIEVIIGRGDKPHSKRGRGYTKPKHNEAKAKMRRKMAKKSRRINRR